MLNKLWQAIEDGYKAALNTSRRCPRCSGRGFRWIDFGKQACLYCWGIGSLPHIDDRYLAALPRVATDEFDLVRFWVQAMPTSALETIKRAVDRRQSDD